MSIDRLLSLLQLDPTNLNLQFDCIDLAIATGDFFLGGELIVEAKKTSVNHDGLLHREAILKLHTNQLQEAELIFKELMTKYPEDCSIVYNYFFVLTLLNQNTIVLDAISKYFIDYRFDTKISTLLLQNLHLLGYLEKAIQHIDTYMQICLGNASWLGVAAQILLDDKQSLRCADIAKKSLSLDPTNIDASVCLSYLQLIDGQYEIAENTLLYLMKRAPKNGRVWLGLGLLYLQRKKGDASVMYLEHATQLIPKHIGSWHALSWAYLMNNNIIKAREIMAQSLEINHNFAETWGGLAVLNCIDGNYILANEQAYKGYKLDSNAFLPNYALILLENKQMGKNISQDIFILMQRFQNFIK